MNEFLQQFLIESRELAQQATAGLLRLERAPQDAALLDEVFRAMHTLKGGAGIVGFPAMERAVHAAEDVLSAARAGTRVLEPALIGDCLACLDAIGQWLDHIEHSGELPSDASGAAANAIVARFDREIESQAAPGLSSPAGTELPPRARELLVAQLALVGDASSRESPGRLASAAQTAANVLRSAARAADAAQLASLVAPGNVQDLLPTLQRVLAQVLAGDPADLRAPAPTAPDASMPAIVHTLRVDAGRIDALVRLTGELTVAKNALAHLAKLAATEGSPMAAALKARHAQFEHLIGELQRAVLALRVLPLRVVFQRLPRLLREMSESLGKPAQLRVKGEATEADKVIVEMLFEPLLHVLRNAMDHGVESSAVRAERGKAPEATIEIRAARQGDHVLVEVEDDGGGMDVQRIRDVATERGVADAAALEAMSESQILELVFRAGFSTAAGVTTLSGRGVGMDTVRKAVERIGGRVSIESVAQQSTTIRFTLPVSVMMTTVMSLEAAGQMFGVPLDNVVETLRVPRSALTAVGAARAVVVRDQTIAVFPLAQMLGEVIDTPATGDATLVITAVGGQYCGLEVDAVGERLDIMLKPLEGLLAGTPGIAGTTLMGDGRVLLVLDIAELLQ